MNSIKATMEPFNMCSIDNVFHKKDAGVKVRPASLFMNLR